jgi:hypothetical protein
MLLGCTSAVAQVLFPLLLLPSSVMLQPLLLIVTTAVAVLCRLLGSLLLLLQCCVFEPLALAITMLPGSGTTGAALLPTTRMTACGTPSTEASATHQSITQTRPQCGMFAAAAGC